MTKAEIVDSVYERVGGFSKKEAAEVVEAVFETMKNAIVDDAARLEVDGLDEGEESKKVTAIKISGFGNFVVRAKPQRTGRNPQTGDPIPISARRVLTFKPSQVLKGILNPHKSATPRPARAASAAAGDSDSVG
jgi:integration host factor subunit alpha